MKNFNNLISSNLLLPIARLRHPYHNNPQITSTLLFEFDNFANQNLHLPFNHLSLFLLHQLTILVSEPTFIIILLIKICLITMPNLGLLSKSLGSKMNDAVNFTYIQLLAKSIKLLISFIHCKTPLL